jgi:UDP-N-acetyl-2-amino-2-deoxyglucuronate dehydrogenase
MNNFALIGNGFIAPRHLDAMNYVNGECVVVCDINPEREIPGIPFFTDYKEMMKSPIWNKVDWVSICAPNYLHVEMALEATRTGKKVICEKPLAIKSSDIFKLPRENVFTVLQLRYHPEVIKAQSLRLKNGELAVKVKRDQSYWDGWKGDRRKSGGILFNLGVHYFDLLIHLYGNNLKVLESEYADRKATGVIQFGEHKVTYDFEIMASNEGQMRKLAIGNDVIQLSNQDNLSYEDLHKNVYEEVLAGNGLSIHEASRAIQLIELLI